MSMTAFELMAKLSLDKSNYDKGLTDAESQGNNAGSKIGNALGNAAKVGLGIATAATGAAAVALGRLASEAVSSYSQYEQLVGGVEKLYQNASDKVVDYADKAYMTSGMSANNYMEIATSFSAALINSLGGDMDKAADMTDLAMRSISDNVNVFGSDIQSVQYAFQGFAKQNYTMLDNLKLGYGGTKSEMERLIKDANEYGATIGDVSNLSINSFADIVKAIDLIQQKQGIAGTTAKEAMHTIEGAARATQAAWKNVITAIAGGGDLQKAFDGLIQSLFGDGSEGSGLLANVIPRIKQTMDGIGQFVAKASPYITKYLPQLFEAILPPLLDSAVQLVISLASALPSIIKIIIETIPRLMHMVAQALQKEFPIIGGVFEGLAKLVERLFGFIADNGKTIQAILAGVLAGFIAFKTINFLQTMIPQIITMITTMVGTLTSSIAAMELMGAATTGLTGVLGGLTGAVELLNGVLLANPIGLVVGAIVGAIAVLGALIYHLATEEEAVKSLDEAQKNHEETVKNLTSAQGAYIDSLKGLQDAQNELAQAQEETGLSGEELYNQFMQNKDAYMQMSPEQQRVLDLYIQMQEKQQSLKDSTEELAKAQSEEMVAGLQEQASAIKENGGNWDEYKQNVINAFNQQKISQDEAKQLLGEAMSEMSSDSQVAFMQDIPNNIKDGLNPSNYETDWQGFKNNWDGFWNLLTGKSDASFSDVISQSKMSVNGVQFSWSDVGNWFSGKWNEISGAFSGAADWFGFVFGVAKDRVSNAWDNIGSWFSGIWEDIKSAFDIDSLFEWGSHMIENFINGIKAAWEGLKNVVTGIGDFIADIFKHTTPKTGPLKGDDKWTVHMMDNFIGGIEKSKGKLKKSINSVADMMAEPMTMNVDGVFSSASGKNGYNNSMNNTYNIVFNQPMKSAVDVARVIREEAQYGLLGGY